MPETVQTPRARLGWLSGLNRWLGRPAIRAAEDLRAAVAADYEGGMLVSTGSIIAVSIANIADVQSHQVFRAIGSTSHLVRFVGGGELHYVFDDRGRVIAMSATGVRSEVSAQHVVTVAALNGR